MVLLKKSIAIEYEKMSSSESNNTIEYWMFFIDDDLLMNFAKDSNIKTKPSNKLDSIKTQPINDRLLSYLESLRPYFNDEKSINTKLIKLKLLELLYDLEAKDESLIPVSYTHLRAHETRHDLVCRLLLEKKKKVR
ncbi:hypothetical protein BN3590_02139 [Clostridium sp. C105KSO15]|nr:hypothetical protein BN3590_02139 [Clostridium sp. C105KSO15]